MSTYVVKATQISNRDANPKVLTDGFVAGGTFGNAEGYVATHGAADGAGSTYLMFEVPSNARVEAVKILTSALGTGCTLDVGVYWPTYIPAGTGLASSIANTAINTALFASALAASNANTVTDVTNQSTNNGIANQELPLWQAAGLASDPDMPLDIVVHVAGAVAAAGLIGLHASYVY